MRAIEAVGTIDRDGRIVLDEALPPDVSGRVRLILLLAEDAPDEDIYTLRDGRPFDDGR